MFKGIEIPHKSSITICNKCYNEIVMEKETEERLTAIEMKLAYMEDFVSQIQNVAVDQAKTIDKLQKEIKLMSDRIREMSNAMEGDIPNRKPPHY